MRRDEQNRPPSNHDFAVTSHTVPPSRIRTSAMSKAASTSTAAPAVARTSKKRSRQEVEEDEETAGPLPLASFRESGVENATVYLKNFDGQSHLPLAPVVVGRAHEPSASVPDAARAATEPTGPDTLSTLPMLIFRA